MGIEARLCVLCRGGRSLCGRAYCPLLLRARIWGRVAPLRLTTALYGTSPPAVFVGRYGYPRVYVGPLAPPEQGDTSLYDMPEGWWGLTIDEVIEMRTSLVLGRTAVAVTDVESRIVQAVQELVLSARPTDVEMLFEKPPRGAHFSEFEPPMGPRAELRSLRVVGSTSSHRAVERLYADYSTKASEAVVELYRAGIPVSYIQKLLSVGALGRAGHRRLVPTRWSITAVDDAISRRLVEERVKQHRELDEVQVFVREVHRNLFVAILAPGRWCFEWMEAWFPGSTWNPLGGSVVIEGDYELYTANRRTYASIGGCYYAARLATAEYMDRVQRQGVAILLREIYPGFDVPIGVWFVREQLRAMYRGKPVRVSSLEEALSVLEEHSKVGARVWAQRSRLLGLLTRQSRLDDFMRGAKR